MMMFTLQKFLKGIKKELSPFHLLHDPTTMLLTIIYNQQGCIVDHFEAFDEGKEDCTRGS